MRRIRKFKENDLLPFEAKFIGMHLEAVEVSEEDPFAQPSRTVVPFFYYEVEVDEER